MTDIDIDTPSAWRRHSDEEKSDSAIVEYERKTADGMTFIVSVSQRTVDTEEYLLHLSTINPRSTPVRHDYPIEEYETREEAITEAEAFIQHLSRQLHTGAVSSADPTIDEIQEMIQEFTDAGFFPPLHHLVRRLR